MPATASSGKFYTCGANQAFGFISQESGIRSFNAVHMNGGKLTFHSQGIMPSATDKVLDFSIRSKVGAALNQLVLLVDVNNTKKIRRYNLTASTNPSDACLAQMPSEIIPGGFTNITNIINADMDGDGVDDYFWLGPGNIAFQKSDPAGSLAGSAFSSIFPLSPTLVTGHGYFKSKTQEQIVVLLIDMSTRVSSLQVIGWKGTSFELPTAINLKYLYTQLVVEDLNGDGYSDLLLLGIDVSAVAVLPGGPNGLGQPILYQTGNGPLSLTVASPNVTVGGLRPDILTYHGGPTPHLFRLRNLSP
jgi:hypothetical protein